MLRYTVNRVLLMIPTLIGVAVLVFFLLRVVPGDIVEVKLRGDGGNVSQAVPALHGYFRIVEREVRPHSREFAAACRTPRALDGMVQAAKAMALTACDLIHRPALLQTAREEWKQRQTDHENG